MPKAIGNIIAVAAVLEIHIEIKAEIPPKVKRIRYEFPPTHFKERMLKAKRRSRPCKDIASASIKLPIKRKTIGSAKGAKTVEAGATPKSTHNPAPKREVTGIGIGSQIQ